MNFERDLNTNSARLYYKTCASEFVTVVADVPCISFVAVCVRGTDAAINDDEERSTLMRT
ncbi:hypothetical protein OUZ56_027824 [Daphnia magna]|uniref:Uncharacterized protein n=1 Tax=Daphnia magna TaxID=35525 RepID=A0ABR0B215_9CRUS|nr:hypothetical protein OUZ56_027824 [Daphnia magna]